MDQPLPRRYRAYWSDQTATHWDSSTEEARTIRDRQTEKIARRAALNVPSCILVSLSRLAHQKHKSWRKSASMGDKRPPWMNRGHPMVWA